MEKLAGAAPHDPKAFFRALLAKDQGSLAAFYFALSHADAVHQRFFTTSSARAKRFYKWYRNSKEFRSMALDAREWRQEMFRRCPLMTPAACDSRAEEPPGI